MTSKISLCYRLYSTLPVLGEYIDRILRDMDDRGVWEDGSTQLGALVKVALLIRGWGA